MKLTFNLVLFVSLGFLIEIRKAEEGLDLNIQHDYQIKFERVELLRYNKALMKDLSLVTFKHNRTTAVMNITFTFQIDVGNDIAVITQAYTFLSNEYRHFPMRFAMDACKAVAANVAGLRTSLACGNSTGCPFLKGRRYHVCNWYPDQVKFPPFIPDGQYKFETQWLHFSAELGVMNMYLTVSRPILKKE